MTARATVDFLLASLLFVLSGALGLGYELVWIQKASLVVGASQIALATVLTSFFLGLGLGSLVVSRYLTSRRWSPLFVYGLFETAIGVFALLFPLIYRGVELAYGALYPVFDGSAAGLTLLRFVLMFALFLVPTFFMGGTLPLLLDGLVARDRLVGSLTSLLYGLNIVGAVIGVLVTAYFAIPHLGLNGTSRLAGLGNLAIAATALVYFRRLQPLHPDEARPRLGAFFIPVAFASGFAAIGYQVVWARYFSLFTHPYVYFTAVLLAVFLAALAVGSMVLAPLLRGRIHPLRILVVLQPLVPITAFVFLEAWTLVRYDVRVNENFEVIPRWALWSETVDATFLAPILAVAAVIFIPVVLLGTGLPAIIAAATERATALRSIAGRLVFWNTLGSSAGGLVTGYALIPGIGLTGAFAVLSLVSIALSVAAEGKLAFGSATGYMRYLRPGFIPAAVGLLFVAMWTQSDITRRTLIRHGRSTAFEEGMLLAINEGPLTTAYVFDGPQSRSLGAGSVRLAVAYHHRVSPQTIQGYIPALLYPKQGWPKSVLGIALGTGQTFGGLLSGPVERMDVVDISSEVVDLAFEHFAPYNNNLASDERVRLHLDDGRHFVDRAPDGTYDVVSLEPPPPTNEGVYRLYSLEFYQGVRRVLRDGGVLAQWLPPNLVTPDDLRGMLKTQAEVFPQTFVVRTGYLDLLVLSIKTDQPPVFHLDWIEQRLGILLERERRSGRSLFVGARVEGLLAMFLTGPEDIAELAAPCLHRDDDERLSYSSGDRELMRRYLGHGLEQLTIAALPITPFERLQKYFDRAIPVAALEEDRVQALADYGVTTPQRLEAAEDRYFTALAPQDRADAAWAIAELHNRRLHVEPALEWIRKAIEAYPGDLRPASVEAARRVAAGRGVLFGDEIRAWLDALPPDLRAAPVTEALAEELAAVEQRQAEQRSRYLWE